MVARVSILVPFHLWIPENAALAPIELDQPPYHLAVHSPRQVMHTETQNAPDEPIPLGRLTASPNLEFSDFFRLQTEPSKEVWRTARADLFQIDIRASDFDRREENCENNSKKLAQIALAALNSVSRKLRLLTRSPVLHQLGLQQTRWSIEYLDDDCRELRQETGKIRRYSGETDA